MIFDQNWLKNTVYLIYIHNNISFLVNGGLYILNGINTVILRS